LGLSLCAKNNVFSCDLTLKWARSPWFDAPWGIALPAMGFYGFKKEMKRLF